MASIEPIVDIDRHTGELISGWERCRQSILVILTTRLRTRVMRRWWGSNVIGMLDKPGNEQTFVEGLGAALLAINRYEPEFAVSLVSVQGPIRAGQIVVTVQGTYKPDKSARKITYNL